MKHFSGISAECIAASRYEDTAIYTLVTRAPKFLDAECVTGDTLLHFERLTGCINASGDKATNVAKVSVSDFYDKWKNGLLITKKAFRIKIDVSLVEGDCLYSESSLSSALGKNSEFVGSLRRRYECFPSITDNNGCYRVDGAEFKKWVSRKRGETFSYMMGYRTTLSNMDIRCVDTESLSKTTTRVIDIWKSGEKEVYRLKSGNSEIKTSANHLFLTQRGWVKLCDLDMSSDVVVMVNHTGYGKKPKNYLSFNRAEKLRLLDEQNWKCLDCATSIDKTCDVHHVKPVTTHPELAFNKDNIVALCVECHEKRHVKLKKATISPKFYSIDSIERVGVEMTYDLQVEHKDSNFVANGFVVHNCEKHRMLSSNSSSSRAIPLARTIDQVLEDPYVPFDVRHNQKGMQGYKRLEGDELLEFQEYWRDRAVVTAARVGEMDRRFKAHKQHLNRLLEPFVWQQKVVTATEWDNFFELRLSEGAQPEMRVLAECMREAIDTARVVDRDQGDWHIPFEREGEDGLSLYERLMISAARCARISYANHGRTDISYDADMVLAERLLADKHLSVFEHQATPLCRYEDRSHTDKYGELWSANFRNWVQFRKTLEV